MRQTESKWEEEPLFVRNRIRHLIFQDIFIIANTRTIRSDGSPNYAISLGNSQFKRRPTPRSIIILLPLIQLTTLQSTRTSNCQHVEPTTMHKGPGIDLVWSSALVHIIKVKILNSSHCLFFSKFINGPHIIKKIIDAQHDPSSIYITLVPLWYVVLCQSGNEVTFSI